MALNLKIKFTDRFPLTNTFKLAESQDSTKRWLDIIEMECNTYSSKISEKNNQLPWFKNIYEITVKCFCNFLYNNFLQKRLLKFFA